LKGVVAAKRSDKRENNQSHFLSKVRQFSTKSNKNIGDKMSDFDLNEWLRGFTDGEGCFLILDKKNGPFSFRFVFKIKLHKADRPLLEYLSTRIKIGQVYPKDIENENVSTTWEVGNKANLLRLIEIFDKHPLNTTKYLDYLLWREAFFMYQELRKASVSVDQKTIVKDKILKLKEQMNKKRLSFVLPSDHKINITPFWLLGFIEGEAWFHVRKQTFVLTFGLGQTTIQKAVIEAIALFLNNLIPKNLSELTKKSNFIHIDQKEATKNTKPFVYLSLSDSIFILNVLIPFLDSLTFISKKGLDYIDWKNVALLRKEGKHLTAEGKILISNIRNRMNNSRTTKI
jgi:LAGLIDADG endonuclease